MEIEVTEQVVQPDTVSVAVALANAMGEVQSISKDQKVTTGPAKFNFRGVDDVMQAVGPALRKHGVIFAPSKVVSLEQERYETTSGSKMHGVVVVMEYTVTGPRGDTMLAAAAGQASDSGDKAVPKAMSVAFRTVLLEALCIPTGDPDPDASVHVRAGSQQQVPVDWLKELAECKTADAVVTLGKRAAQVGEWDKYETQFRARKATLEKAELQEAELQAAAKTVEESGLTDSPKAE